MSQYILSARCLTLVQIDDGYCVIDVVHKKGVVADFASAIQIRTAATQLLHTCIERGAPNRGGMIKKVGGYPYKNKLNHDTTTGVTS